MVSNWRPYLYRLRRHSGNLTLRPNPGSRPRRSNTSPYFQGGVTPNVVRRRSQVSIDTIVEGILSYVRRRRLMSQTPNKKEEAWDRVEEEIFSSTENGDELKDCSICLQSYKEGEELVRLPCRHRFHVGCLNSWIRIRSNCPYCRRVLHLRFADWICVGILS
ncbi:43kDa postsynaptic protein [Parasponia andersonii]|uniref:43kDa postsynaptic protein n=1 Tax=Parasponia andersonii TaxID=3476 RepID=A0A2P5AWF7_PARAD|nr:43kDa postsynaptic protein [Parasponia andersonii]